MSDHSGRFSIGYALATKKVESFIQLSLVNHAKQRGKKLAAGKHRAKGIWRMQKDLKSCNIFNGHWAWDQSYPFYDASDCPHVRKEFNCQKYGHPDKFYLKFKWQPDDCDLPTHAS
ncbi:hypothetical protein Ancab_009301 [Ancistrocladus abbreviatus]